MKIRTGHRTWSAVFSLVLLVPCVLALMPFFYMFVVSLQQTRSLSWNFDWENMNLINYERIFRNFDFGHYALNSIAVSSLACFFNCLVCAMAAFGFEKKRFPGKRGIFFLYIATMMVPGQVTLIPVFLIMRSLSLLNTYVALSLPIINAFGVFLIRQFMVGLPNELLEAAHIDGAGEVKTFTRIVIPLIKPVLVSLVVFTFISTWNDFVWPLVVASDSSMHTLTLALSVLRSNYSTNYGLVMAASTLTFIFPFVLYMLLQKQFVEGIALSGIKA